MPLAKLENVTFSYDKKINVIKDVSLQIEKGEYVAVIGKNGSGKSTLAKLLNALLIPDKGSVTVDEYSSANKKQLFEIRKRVGVVFQNPDNQIVASIVEDDVAFGPENLGIPRKEIGERIDYALNAVGMQEYRHSSPMHLSGGQKQRIAIAGVLALKPEILVLDESTAMLDPKGRKEVLDTVRELNAVHGVTVITITHYMDEILDADRVIVMQNGKIAMEGTPRRIFSEKEKIKKLGLELPLAMRISEELISRGLPLKEGILTREDLAEELCSLKRKI
ncbi:MAG: energy-coupling factor transporter ATPase [Clostridiales bacterium]|nr:energy-coupling factor transporter ATPase [Clostridiales bacterium]